MRDLEPTADELVKTLSESIADLWNGEVTAAEANATARGTRAVIAKKEAQVRSARLASGIVERDGE